MSGAAIYEKMTLLKTKTFNHVLELDFNFGNLMELIIAKDEIRRTKGIGAINSADRP